MPHLPHPPSTHPPTHVPHPTQAILNGLRDSVSDFSGELHGVSNKEIMELLLVTQVRA